MHVLFGHIITAKGSLLGEKGDGEIMQLKQQFEFLTYISLSTSLFMKYIFLFLFTIVIFSCENNSFDRDKRQLIAKDEIRGKLSGIQSFDITGFKEDTLHEGIDGTFKNPIRYTLQVVYKDSAGVLQNKEGFVVFTPDGKSVISSRISN